MLVVFLPLSRLRHRRQCINLRTSLDLFAVHFLNRSIEMEVYHPRSVPATFTRSTPPTLFRSPCMTVSDLAHTWRRSLVFLARGLWTCSLVALYLFISLALCSGSRMARAVSAPPSHPQASLRKESTGSSPSSAAEEKPSAVREPAHAGFDTPFDAHEQPLFVSGQLPVLSIQESARSTGIPKIVVQDFSAEDGLVRYKTPEYDLTHTLKRRRRLSWVRSPSLEDYLAVRGTSQPPFRLPSAGQLRPLYLADGLKHRRSDVFVQNLLGFPGGKRVLGDVVAKDGSFVIVGL